MDRRSFLSSAAPLLLALPSFARGQTLIERGGFDEQQFPLVREKLLNLLNDERSAAGLSRLQLDDLACKVATDHANDMIRGQFLSHCLSSLFLRRWHGRFTGECGFGARHPIARSEFRDQ
ncbi:MAG: hypothetical protein DMF73_06605 [Acidobacteria bacterium]|nr:MAG: hypothetical protein DMF73_06605 [Acidobacteriota bacterium]